VSRLGHANIGRASFYNMSEGTMFCILGRKLLFIGLQSLYVWAETRVAAAKPAATYFKFHSILDTKLI
jgi:hypothetical protein